MGLWNGLTIVISFVVSLFDSNVNIYQVANNGGFYNFGFVVGALFQGLVLGAILFESEPAES
jgi:hypothetical protein